MSRYSAGKQATAGELSNDPDQCGDPEFNLMAIQMTAHASIPKRQRKVLAVNAFHQDAFVHDRAVPRLPPQGVYQHVGRRRYVVQQTEQAQVRCLRQVKPEKIVVEGVGDQIQKSNLVANLDECARALHLPPTQPRLFEERV